MSNIIKLDSKSSIDDCLCMSNGSMDAFIDILVVTGSELAQTDTEKEFVVWLSEKDQSIVGIGTVGFSITQMPWTKGNFDSEKGFLIKIIEAAESKHEWNELGYTPNFEILMPFFEHFKALVSQMTRDKINENERNEWIESAEKDDPVKCGFLRCEKHNILLSIMGCKICNTIKTLNKKI